MNHHRLLPATLIASAIAFCPEAHAQEQCEVSSPIEKPRLLRRLSLDLRDRLPAYEEMETILASTDPDGDMEAMIESYLSTPAFTEVMRTHHKELLWPNIDQIEFIPGTHILYPLPLASGPVYVSPLRSAFSRVVGGANLFLPCLDQPAQFDANGDLVLEPFEMGGELVAYLDGWVEMEPYWAPGTTIRVCALDAQDELTAPACPGPLERYPFLEPTCANIQGFATQLNVPFRGDDVSCDSRWATFTPGCGCGPNLQWCQTEETARVTLDSLLEQELRFVDRAISDRPYSTLLTDSEIEYNGPVAHYIKYQSRLAFDLEGDITAAGLVPDIPFTQVDEWVPSQRSSRHSGVLTTPGYLLRFSSNRGRAHRFYGAFECSSFIPDGPLPPPSDPCSQHEDLTLRCGCDACHIALEPMAAHWGRFSEFGYAELDEARFPANGLQRCTAPWSSLDEFLECLRHYELDPVGEEVPYAGMLNSYVFRSPEEQASIEQGPGALVQASIDSGRFNACTIRRMWTQFMRRPPTPEEETEVFVDLNATFEQNNYSLKALVKAILLHPAYGREL